MAEDQPDLPGHLPPERSSFETNDRVGFRKPPAASRFKPGRSGNPAGRRKKLKPGSASAFTLVLDKTITVRANGRIETRTVEEALQLRTYQEALKGKSMAVREVLRWILKREQWLAKNRPARENQFTFAGTSQDPDNADEAMLLLGIAAIDPKGADRRQERAQLLLEPWAVKAALKRVRRAHGPTAKELEDIRRCTRDDGTIVWPAGEPQ